MKKPNISGDAIKQFFFNNGEKIVLAATVVVLFMFMYSAFTSKPLDDTKSPQSIEQASRQVTDLVNSSTYTDHLKQTQQSHPASYAAVVESFTQPAPEAAYKLMREINPPLFQSLTKRPDPQIFPVEEPQVAAGRGLIADTAPGGAPGVMPVMPGFAGFEGGHGPPTMMGAPMVPAIVGSGAGAGPQRLAEGTAGVQAPSQQPKGKTYAILTAAVPYHKQVREYDTKFANALPASPISNEAAAARSAMNMVMGPQGYGYGAQQSSTEEPIYWYFQIERAEVADENDPVRNWTEKKLYLLAVKDLYDNWALKPPQTPEIVDANYLVPPSDSHNEKYPVLYPTWPLPPLYLKNWGLEASNPKVKLVATEETPQGETGQPAQQQQEFDLGGGNEGGAPAATQPGDAPAAKPAAPALKTPPAVLGAPRVLGPQPGVARGGPLMGSDHGVIGPTGPGGFGRGPAGGWAGAPMTNPYAPGQSAQAAAVDYKLFRFVDLTAEPDKTYRYRVQTVIWNPNYKLEKQCLADPNSTDKKTLSSSWVEFGPITIPREFQLLAESVTGGRNAEPKARMSVLALVKAAPPENSPMGSDAEYWLEVKQAQDIALGGMPDFRSASYKDVPDPSAETRRDIDKATLDTHGTTVVDVRNDDPLGASRTKGPTEVLTIDDSGRLVLGSSAADALVAKDYAERTPKESTGSGGGGETPKPEPKPLRTQPYRGIGPPGIAAPQGPRTIGPGNPVPPTNRGSKDSG